MSRYVILVLFSAVSFAAAQEVDPQMQEVIDFLSDREGAIAILSISMMVAGLLLLMKGEFYLGIIMVCGSIVGLFLPDVIKQLAGIDVSSSHVNTVYIFVGIALLSTIAKGVYVLQENTLFFENFYDYFKDFFSRMFSKRDKTTADKIKESEHEETAEETTENQYHIDRIEKSLELFKNDKYVNKKEYKLLKDKTEQIIKKVFEIKVKYEVDRFELKRIIETHIPELIKRYLSTLPEKRNFNELINSLNKLEDFIEHVAKNSFDDGSKFKAYKNFIDEKYEVGKDEKQQ